MSYMKPVPAPDPDSAPFWRACRNHKLIIQKCADCGAARFPAKSHCAECQSSNHEWIDAKPTGKVYSWIVVHHPVPKPVYADDVPYIVALIDLDDGVRIVSNIIGCDPADVRPDMRVRIEFDDVNEDLTLPKFCPAVG